MRITEQSTSACTVRELETPAAPPWPLPPVCTTPGRGLEMPDEEPWCAALVCCKSDPAEICEGLGVLGFEAAVLAVTMA